MLVGRLRSSLFVAGLSVAALLGTAGAGSAGPPSTLDATCPSNALCLYSGTGYTGDMLPLVSLNPGGTCVSLVAEGWGDRARSVVNTHSRSAALFQNDDCLGDPYQVAGNSSIPNLGSFSPESAWVN
ncbi:peptidase inhibitor family I36 protein [Plantactinospora sp. ZYX-F-223]|uniref:peptidase inhibitor family I36 protein n=1 Tax=Plantactinospora sp. ZYX-F-223 TaxID=3144103 RepID=UPI0031FDAD6C